MKRPEGQAELKRIAARGMLETALQTLGSLEAVEQLLRERRKEEAARKADEAERAAQEEQRRLREVKAAAQAQIGSARDDGAAGTLEHLDFARVRMDEVRFVDASDEVLGMGGVSEATVECVCDATSDVNVVDEAGMPARVFEANACLAKLDEPMTTSSATSCGC
ncbi:hypothetical protein H310_11567 [Aphanomyces invadans]|uniref:Uncharacterized protein n=1 Tax=Aphanomyces invadans TaxID=157072 RepID=A0A024TMU6_9STRA|nr:hypothetical protein H310_11567 [Aphanomyces invadans]ETV94921.1 hypothetical protein H310_11567 [Aphanomyces invadans]|eukprot:XP_008876512.1 hypothetical protein H310_11567 [Aphanomyces invadans]